MLKNVSIKVTSIEITKIIPKENQQAKRRIFLFNTLDSGNFHIALHEEEKTLFAVW